MPALVLKKFILGHYGLFYMLAIDESLLVYWNINDLRYASSCFQRHFNADYDNAYQRGDKRRQAFGMSLWSMSLALAPAVGPVLAGFLIDLIDYV
ncbi:hypothetical protein BLX87_22935 [Bacillus sp. VT-16-64]|nr:hypothetical protein BLX87_22935 [Bacillus sp. VT-16-64]